MGRSQLRRARFPGSTLVKPRPDISGPHPHRHDLESPGHHTAAAGVGGKRREWLDLRKNAAQWYPHRHHSHRSSGPHRTDDVAAQRNGQTTVGPASSELRDAEGRCRIYSAEQRQQTHSRKLCGGPLGRRPALDHHRLGPAASRVGQRPLPLPAFGPAVPGLCAGANPVPAGLVFILSGQ